MITFRLIQHGDATRFREALDSVCRERRYLAQLEAPPIERVEAFVNANVQGNVSQFVALDGAKIVGWCDALPGGPQSGTNHVGRLGMGVVEGYRRQKIGRQLIEMTLKHAALSLEKIELTVHASNAPAIALYRRLGFAEEGRRSRAWLVDGIYDDIILMALRLRN